MKLRDRILAVLRQPDYAPVNELGLARRLDLNKKERHSLSHEVRLLLAKGELARVKGDRLALPGEDDAIEGKIQFRAGGSAFVIPDSTSENRSPDLVQIAAEDTGVALPGDRVAVKVHLQLAMRRDGRGQEQTGRVTRVIERAHPTVVGRLQKIRSTYYIIADDPRFVHEVYVDDPAKSDLRPSPEIGDKVIVKLNEWTSRSQPLAGKLIERLGKTFEPRAELAGIYHKYHLETEFPAEVEREVAAFPSQVREKDLVGRLDYREIPTLTIDPDDAKDFDDALSIETLENGDVRVGVHIADVSSYVKVGTALDREAQKRGNSTYLVGTVVPMLPEKLSNGLCSLVEKQDRLCKAVLLTFDKKGRVRQAEFANTVIRSFKRLTYKQAYAFLFENDLDKIRALPLPPKHQTGSTGRALNELSNLELVDVQSWLRKLWIIAKKLREDRMAHGSLDLEMPETKVFVDENGYADRLEKIEHDESHQLIEEFMLAANEAVARLTRTHRLPSIYRVHDEPDEEKLNEYRNFVATYGIQVGDLTKREEVVKLLEALRHHPQGYTLRTQFLRSLRKAVYRASPDGHYGLHKKDYTHFTSPIRRYSDLVVHRVFDYYLIKHGGHAAPNGYSLNLTLGKMESIAEHLSLTEVNSTEAERESVKIKLLEFFERELTRKPKTRFAAIITDIRPNGFFIELTESMTFGFVAAATLDTDQFQLNNAGTAMIGRRSKRRLQVGTLITVVVEKVDRYKRLMDFRLVDDSKRPRPAE